MELKICITKELKGKTVKDILKNSFNLSNRLIIKLKKCNQIYCNSKNCYTNYIVDVNDIVSVDISFSEQLNNNIIPNNEPLDILYEDDSLLIVNKGPGIPTHPSMKHFDNTLSNYVKAYFIKQNIVEQIRPVNRLDKDTSGIVVFAKNQYIQECLIKQMKSENFKKYYSCIISGIISPQCGTISLPIAREKNSIIKRCVDSTGQNAITIYKTEKTFEYVDNIYSLLEVYLKTGRTHQIRVHFSYLGYPLFGDTLYGNKCHHISRQALHCKKIEFIHPITNENICINCPLPDDMKIILN